MVLSPVGHAPNRVRPRLVLETPRAEWFSYRAAMIVMMVMALGASLVRRYSAPPPPPAPPASDYLQYLSDPEAGIPPVLTYGWIADRKPRSHPDAVSAVRVGARMVDLEAAALARKKTAYAAWPGVPAAVWAAFHDIPYSNWPINPDARQRVRLESAHVESSAGEITNLLAGVRFGGNAAWAFRRVQEEAWDWVDLNDVQDAHTASRVLPMDRVALGSWLEASRIAAVEGDTAFFQQRPVLDERAKALRLGDLSETQQAALRQAIRDSNARSAVEFATLAAELTKALWLLAK